MKIRTKGLHPKVIVNNLNKRTMHYKHAIPTHATVQRLSIVTRHLILKILQSYMGLTGELSNQLHLADVICRKRTRIQRLRSF